ncbi:hypothetical protein C8R44DRAFT_611296 [Mycena epipterygia]|nr:hypothetical protein C8R44DRAFT_611296 [Mycena epipterygia]
MFLSPLASLCSVAVALAVPQIPAHPLSVALSSPSSSVHSIRDLTLSAAVTNNGAEDIKVLKYGTILDADLPTRSFTVTRNDTVVPFTGVKLSISLIHAGESAYTTIPVGKTVTVVHNVSALYDFASVGTGSFSFAPVTTFQSARAELTTIEAAASPITIAVTGDVAPHTLSRRSVDICKDASKKAFIDASYTEAKELASIGSRYVASRGASDSLYKAYWGDLPTSRVRAILDAVANENSTSRTLSCVDPFDVCSSREFPGTIAYTVIATTNIYFCNIFFEEVPTTRLCSGTSVEERIIRGGTTLHEITHAACGTGDVTYGCFQDRGLSDQLAIKNADSFNCFATQVYKNTKC